MLTRLDKVENLEHSHNLWRVTFFECFAGHLRLTVKLHPSSTVEIPYIIYHGNLYHLS